MALIKCPECNKEVSTSAQSCPNCGYPISKTFDNKLKKKAPAPISNEWLDGWKSAPNQTKLIIFGFFVVSLILLFVFTFLLKADKEAEYSPILEETFYHEKGIWIAATSVFSFITFFLFISMILSLFMLKVYIKNIDGYNIVVYLGFWKNYLIIENNQCDSNWGSIFHNTLLSGELPNGNQVTVTLSSGSVSYKVDYMTNANVDNNIIQKYDPTKEDKKLEEKLPNSKKISKETEDIINRINKCLYLLLGEKNTDEINNYKSIINTCYQQLIKCPDIDKEDISNIENRITEVYVSIKYNK